MFLMYLFASFAFYLFFYWFCLALVCFPKSLKEMKMYTALFTTTHICLTYSSDAPGHQEEEAVSVPERYFWHLWRLHSEPGPVFDVWPGEGAHVFPQEGSTSNVYKRLWWYIRASILQDL